MQEETDKKEYYDAIDWYEELRKGNRAFDTSATIIERLNQSRTYWQRKGLTHALMWEYRRQGRFGEAADLLELEAAAEPDNPLPLISLAEQKLYHERDSPAALVLVDRAVRAAVRAGNFQRHALAVRARIALSMNNYILFGDCLQQIASLKVLPSQRDVGKERDFFDAADKSKLSVEAVEAFEKYLIT